VAMAGWRKVAVGRLGFFWICLLATRIHGQRIGTTWG
jgi:hypothetical protein